MESSDAPEGKSAFASALIAVREGLLTALPYVVLSNLLSLCAGILINLFDIPQTNPVVEFIDISARTLLAFFPHFLLAVIGVALGRLFRVGRITSAAAVLIGYWLLSGWLPHGIKLGLAGDQWSFGFWLFPSMLITFPIFLWLSRRPILHFMHTDDVNPLVRENFNLILPLIATVVAVALVKQGLSELQEIIRPAFDALGHLDLVIPQIIKLVAFVFVVHIAWFFGIHGYNAAVELAIALNDFPLGATPDDVGFLNIYVHIGGAGATLCTIFAILITCRRLHHRRIALVALPLGLFNINEVMLFGLPIIFNRVLLVPFVGLPIFLTIFTSVMLNLGLVPMPTQDISWMVPPLIGPYLATEGNITAPIYQAICILIGIAFYVPFLRRLEMAGWSDEEARAVDRKLGLDSEFAAETRLHDSETRYRKVVQASIDAILVVDEQRIYMANPAALNLFAAATEADMIGHSPLRMVASERHGEASAIIKRVLAGRTFQVNEQELVRLDGSNFVADIVANRVSHEGIPAASVIIRDATDRIRAEQVVRRSVRMEAIGLLTGGIAHDFNNILSIIIGNLELLKRKVAAQADLTGHVQISARAASRAADLTRKLLSISSRQVSDVEVSDLNQIIQEMHELISRILTPQVRLELGLQDRIWPIEINRGDFNDALINMVVNARDAMDGQGVLVIQTRNAEVDFSPLAVDPPIRAGKFVRIDIRDDGKGMNEAQRERIFEPFFTTKAEGKGTGLGMAMVYAFVRRSGGGIRVDSDVGLGTTITIYLPISENPMPAAEVSGSGESQLPGGSETILMVDDEADILHLGKTNLSDLGYRVLTAENGRAALDILKGDTAIDLVVSDVIMPGGISGIALAKLIENDHPQIKILLTSGRTESIETEGNKEIVGASGVLKNLLKKPYSRDQLALRVRQILDGGSKGRDTKQP